MKGVDDTTRQRLGRWRDNAAVATIAIGDIHGNLAALDDLLTKLEPEAHAGDDVVFLGDYIDRGPDVKGCIDRILRFRAETPARVICLCGNHEEWMLDTWADFRRHSWLLGMQPLDTIGSYSPAAVDTLVARIADARLALYLEKTPLPYEVFFDAMPETHRTFFHQLADYHETPDCICVHGGVELAPVPLAEQSAHALRWGGDGFPQAYRGSKVVVYGHWNNSILESGWPRPRMLESSIGIDTIAFGVLTAVRMPDRAIFQSARYETPVD
jgi:serine/threonine protein phosphatase 1